MELKLFTQWTDMQIDIAFALIRPGNISDTRRPGTGPATMAKLKANLHSHNIKIVSENSIPTK